MFSSDHEGPFLELENAIGVSNLAERLTYAQVEMLCFASILGARSGSIVDPLVDHIAALSIVFGQTLDLPEDQLFALYCGSYLHDIGKVAVPEGIWMKPGKLNRAEFSVMKAHTVVGYEMCRPIPAFSGCLPIIRSHHEKWGATGYPDQLGGTDIPFLARVFQIVDCYDAVTTDRQYRRAYTHEEALGALTAAGVDPDLLHAFAAIPISTLEHARATFPRLSLLRAKLVGGEDLNSQSRTDFYSCFISHSGLDATFAKQLNNDLRSRQIKCWYAPEDLKTGDAFRSQIDKSIRLHDKLLLILSASSVASAWVADEVEAAFEEEGRRAALPEAFRGNQLVLFPIRIDDAVFNINGGWAAKIRRTRHIADFRSWQDPTAYQAAFVGLIHDLAVSDEAEARAREARRTAGLGLGG
jgi:hypothetical protein